MVTPEPEERSIGEWGRLLDIDPALLSPVDAEWLADEERWVRQARAEMTEVLDEVTDAQWTLPAQGEV